MSEWFGKEGIVLLGIMFLKSPNVDENGRPFLSREFDDLTTGDKVQDGFLSLILMGIALLRHKERYPHITDFYLQSDCGAHFACSTFVVGLHMLNSRVLNPLGINVREFGLSEPGWGKSAVDAHFSFIGKVLWCLHVAPQLLF